MANAIALGASPTAADLAQALGLAGPQAVQAAFNPGSVGSHFVETSAQDWRPALDAMRPGDPNADPNMQTAPPATGYDFQRLVDPTWLAPQGMQKIASPVLAPDQGQMPTLGPLPGQVFLNPQIAPQVPDGSPRPLSPGEYVKNPQGSWSSEITTTTDPGAVPALNGGQPTVIPTLWVINGVPTRVDEDTAAQLAVQSGLRFPGFKTPEEAESYSQQREDSWQTIDPENAASVPALWATSPASGGP